MPNSVPVVTGQVVLGEDVQPFTHATLRVKLEDVSRADAPAQVLVEQLIHDVSYSPGDSRQIPFALGGAATDERRDYVIRVHVDLNGDGQVQPGDYISTDSYPVLTYGHPRDITVHAHQVAS